MGSAVTCVQACTILSKSNGQHITHPRATTACVGVTVPQTCLDNGISFVTGDYVEQLGDSVPQGFNRAGGGSSLAASVAPDGTSRRHVGRSGSSLQLHFAPVTAERSTGNHHACTPRSCTPKCFASTPKPCTLVNEMPASQPDDGMHSGETGFGFEQENVQTKDCQPKCSDSTNPLYWVQQPDTQYIRYARRNLPDDEAARFQQTPSMMAYTSPGGEIKRRNIKVTKTKTKSKFCCL